MMKTLILAVLFALSSASISADCPLIYSVDDPPCTPCPFVLVGYWFTVGTFADGSDVNTAGERLVNCDGVTIYTTLYRSYWCPNGNDNFDAPCTARDMAP